MGTPFENQFSRNRLCKYFERLVNSVSAENFINPCRLRPLPPNDVGGSGLKLGKNRDRAVGIRERDGKENNEFRIR